VDTAGLRDATCVVEQKGVDRARETIAKADAVLYVLDASQPLTAADREHVQALQEPLIVVLNKVDLGEVVRNAELVGKRCVRASLTNRVGVAELRAAMLAAIAPRTLGGCHDVAVSERHRLYVQNALNILTKVGDTMVSHPNDLTLSASLLRAAINEIGYLTGRTYDNDILSSVFSRFCIGK